MRESEIENELRKQVLELRGKAFKFSSPGNNGVPDRIVLINGKCYFVELKKPGEELRPLQEAVKRKYESMGFKVYVIDTKEKVGEFIHEIYPT